MADDIVIPYKSSYDDTALPLTAGRKLAASDEHDEEDHQLAKRVRWMDNGFLVSRCSSFLTSYFAESTACTGTNTSGTKSLELSRPHPWISDKGYDFVSPTNVAVEIYWRFRTGLRLRNTGGLAYLRIRRRYCQSFNRRRCAQDFDTANDIDTQTDSDHSVAVGDETLSESAPSFDILGDWVHIEYY